MYARGMSQRDIAETIEDIYGFEISHETISTITVPFYPFFAMFHYRETVCCLPSFSGHPLVGLLHYGLRPVQQDRLRICPLQCRQRQQNISPVCVHKAGLSFAKILNCDGQQRSLFLLSWMQSIAKETNKLVSAALKDRQR